MFGGDPFGNPFQNMQRQMQDMDNMMNAMMGDSFGMLNSMMGGRRQPQQMIGNGNLAEPHYNNNAALNPFGGIGGGLFGGLMQQMTSMQHNAVNNPNSTMFSQSTMITYDGNGQPHVVQSSTRKAGDVKETRHSEQRGAEARMRVGHSIGDRSHIIEKKRDREGRVRQRQQFVNLDEDDAVNFNDEFKARATRNLSGFMPGGQGRQQQAIQNGSSSSKDKRRIEIGRGESSAPIITVPDDDDEEEARYNHRHGSHQKKHYVDDEDEDDEVYVTSSHTQGPVIREITDDEPTSSDAQSGAHKAKRHKGLLGKFGL